VIAVSASGLHPLYRGRRGRSPPSRRPVIAIAHRAGSPLLSTADAPIFLDSGAEALRGSDTTGAGTAQKAALGMLSSLMGFELGHVHQGLMVNLKADNAKLRDRARGIVVTIAGVSEVKADAALREPAARSNRRFLIAYGGVSMSEAVAWLAAGEGRIITRCVVRRSSGSIKGRARTMEQSMKRTKGAVGAGVVAVALFAGSRRLRQAR